MVHFIQAKVFYLDVERKKEAVLFEELRGNQEITDFYDLVNSPKQFSSNICGKSTHTSATKTIQSTLNPVKPLILNVSVGNLLWEILCLRL